MDVIEKREGSVVVELTKEELVIVCSAINEVCHGPEAIEDWEFQTRMGVSRDHENALLLALNALA